MSIDPPTMNAFVLNGLLLVLIGMLTLGGPFERTVTADSPVPRKIVDYGGGWKDGQVNEPCILVNPKDATKLIMFYSGMQLGGSSGAIGKAWADAAEPFLWHEFAGNPILSHDPAIPFEAAAIRLDCVIYDKKRDEYMIYYTGSSASYRSDAIGLAACPAGKDGYTDVVPANIERLAANPILSPGGQGRDDELYVSQGAVFREKGAWYSFYSYRTAHQVLPGIRLATSSDGKQWAKVAGPDLLVAAPESLYIEWHQVVKIGKRYVMLYEGYNGGTRWGADVATSSTLTTGWKKASVGLIDQTKWENYSDKTLFHVATPALYRISGRWYLFFQGAAAGPYSIQHWALWGMECDLSFQQP